MDPAARNRLPGFPIRRRIHGGRPAARWGNGHLASRSYERAAGAWELPDGWAGLGNVTVQVPQSIFLDKSRGIGYRRVDECESGSPDKATRGSGEEPSALQPTQPRTTI